MEVKTRNGTARMANKIYFGWVGDLQYELIQPLHDDIGIYTDMLPATSSGITSNSTGWPRRCGLPSAAANKFLPRNREGGHAKHGGAGPRSVLRLRRGICRPVPNDVGLSQTPR